MEKGRSKGKMGKQLIEENQQFLLGKYKEKQVKVLVSLVFLR